MSDNTQPPFLLEVKKEYIIENFDKMLTYLEPISVYFVK